MVCVGSVMIYKILNKEDIGRLKDELSLGLPGTAKVQYVRTCNGHLHVTGHSDSVGDAGVILIVVLFY